MEFVHHDRFLVASRLLLPENYRAGRAATVLQHFTQRLDVAQISDSWNGIVFCQIAVDQIAVLLQAMKYLSISHRHMAVSHQLHMLLVKTLLPEVVKQSQAHPLGTHARSWPLAGRRRSVSSSAARRIPDRAGRIYNIGVGGRGEKDLGYVLPLYVFTIEFV